MKSRSVFEVPTKRLPSPAVPEELHKRYRVLAAQEGITLGGLILKGLAAYWNLARIEADSKSAMESQP